MPITQSAAKALRQSKKRSIQNLSFKRNFKDAVKAFRQEVSKNNLENARSLLPKVYQAADKATKKGVIKKNAASRYKSRLSRLLSSPNKNSA